MDKKIIEKTKCEKQFACLTNKNHVCCKVTECIGKSVCFIENDAKINCHYKMRFGDSVICRCPVLIELHNKEHEK
jgi:hypothetical protein